MKVYDNNKLLLRQYPQEPELRGTTKRNHYKHYCDQGPAKVIRNFNIQNNSLYSACLLMSYIVEQNHNDHKNNKIKNYVNKI